MALIRPTKVLPKRRGAVPVGIRGRLLRALLPVILFSYALFLIETIPAIRDHTDAQVAQQHRIALDALSYVLQQYFREVVVETDKASRLDLMVEALEESDPKKFDWYADETLRASKTYAAMALIDMEGKLVSSNSITRQRQKVERRTKIDLSNTNWFQEIMRTQPLQGQWLPLGSHQFIRHMLGPKEEVLGYARLVRDVLDMPVGVLVISLSLDVVQTSLESFSRRDEEGAMQSLALLTDARGTIVASPTSMTALLEWEDWYRESSITNEQDLRHMVGPNNEDFVVDTATVRRVNDLHPLMLIAASRKDLVDAPLWSLLYSVVVIAVLCLLATILLTAVIADKITLPIRTLAEALDDLGDLGDLDYYSPVPVLSEDESGHLTETFNKTMGTLQENEKRLREAHVRLEISLQRQQELVTAYRRFVPMEFLECLQKSNITAVTLGDNIATTMSVMFCDIRNFTSLSETMTPEENFNFINSYLGRVSPIVKAHGGFIDKYMGDAFMGLFPGTPDDAVQCAINLHKDLDDYNRQKQQESPTSHEVAIGIGINTGSIMLGTVGSEERMEGTVISDAVNLASRVEQLTKSFGHETVITEHTWEGLDERLKAHCKPLGKVQAKGRQGITFIYAVEKMPVQVQDESEQSTTSLDSVHS
jgi:class 3 adenylate cyclase